MLASCVLSLYLAKRTLRDFRLPQRIRWELRSSGLLCSK